MKDITAADVLARTLKDAGIRTIFAITGAGNLAIVDALARQKAFEIIYSHHEQAAVMEAQGYARLTGKLGVALVTTGGGTSNAFTGVLSAHLDSIPVLLISGNESSFNLDRMKDFRAVGVQGFDSTKVFKNVTKLSLRISSESNIEEITNTAMSLALAPRRGPVHLDIPMDIQRRRFEKTQPVSFNRKPSQEKTNEFFPPSEFVTDLHESKRPLLYIGNGARGLNEETYLNDVINRWRIPFALSWSAADMLQEAKEHFVGKVGIYGERSANLVLQQCDLLVCIGTRLAIPQLGYDQNDFARKAKRWVFDIDPIELSKFEGDAWRTVKAEAREVCGWLYSQVQCFSELDAWKERIQFIKREMPKDYDLIRETSELPSGYVHSKKVIQDLIEVLPPHSTVVTDVGAALLSGHFEFEADKGIRLFTSQGLGEMGFGLPGAIGAYFADKTRPLICLNTDGAIMFNLQEMELIRTHRIPIKLFIFNNGGYSMIKISQSNLFEGRMFGSALGQDLTFPSFSGLAELFGLEYCKVDSSKDLSSTLIKVLNTPIAQLIEVKMWPEQRYLPRLGTGKDAAGVLVSPPLEDLDPLIPIDQLRKLLGYEPVERSFQARKLR